MAAGRHPALSIPTGTEPPAASSSEPVVLQAQQPSARHLRAPARDAARHGAPQAAGLEPRRLETKLSSAVLRARAGEAPVAASELPAWQL